jgi:hypothetical protein
MQTPSGIDPWQWWRSLPPQQRLLTGAVQLVLGLAVTFFGYRLFRTFLALTGFVAGASLGLSVGSVGNMAYTAWLLAIAFGLVGALLLWALFRIGALLAGAVLGVAVAGAAAAAIPGAAATEWQWLFLLVGLVVGAILGWRLQRPLIIVVTALSGAWASLVGLAMLIGHNAPGSAVPAALGAGLFTPGLPQVWAGGGGVWLLGTLVLAALGISFQWYDTTRQRWR